MKFLRGEAGEAVAEVVADLSSENAQGSGTGAVASFLAMFQNVGEEIEVGLHGESLRKGERVFKRKGLILCPGTTPVLFFLPVAAFFFDIAGPGADSGAAMAAAFSRVRFVGRGIPIVPWFRDGGKLLPGEKTVDFAGRSRCTLILIPVDETAETQDEVLLILTSAAGSANELLDEVFFEDAQGMRRSSASCLSVSASR